MRRFEQAKAFITGGASGIGRATALRLSSEGAHVCIGDIDMEALNKTSRDIGVEGVEIDVRSEESVESALKTATERLGGLSTLINSAGVVMRKPVDKISESDWRHVVGVNLDGAFCCIKHAIQHLEASGDGAGAGELSPWATSCL